MRILERIGAGRHRPATGDVARREFSNGFAMGDIAWREFSNGFTTGDIARRDSSNGGAAGVFDRDVGADRRVTIFKAGFVGCKIMGRSRMLRDL
jgi:hypothetical protein